jgi:hypothetical protein
MGHIRQIIPAVGWRVVTVAHGSDEVREEPVVCFAVLDSPYPEREDGPAQPVVPMVRARGHYGDTGMGLFELIVGDEAYWKHQHDEFAETFVGYLSPGEDQTAAWVQQGIERARKRWLDE